MRSSVGTTIDQIAGAAHRPGYAAAFDRTVDRRGRAELRLRLRLRLLQHDFLEDADDAAADGEQSAGGVRKAVRRRQQQRRPARPQAEEPQHSRFGDGPGGFAPDATCPLSDRTRLERVSRRHPRNRAPHSESREPDPGRPEAAGSAGRHAGILRRAFQDHVRPAGAGVPRRDHARRDPDVRPRYQRRGLSAERHARRLPRRLAPFQQPRQHGPVRADQQVSRGDAGLLPGQAEIDAGRRRQPAGSFDGSVRQQHEQREPARSRSAAGRAGRRRLGPAARAAVTCSTRRIRRCRTCCSRCSTSWGSTRPCTATAPGSSKSSFAPT